RLEQLDGGLIADSFYAGDVVGGVADEREIVDDPVRRHTETLVRIRLIDPLFLDGSLPSAPRIEKRHTGSDELIEVLVSRDDDGLQAVVGCPLRQGVFSARGRERARDHREERAIDQRIAVNQEDASTAGGCRGDGRRWARRHGSKTSSPNNDPARSIAGGVKWSGEARARRARRWWRGALYPPASRRTPPPDLRRAS